MGRGLATPFCNRPKSAGQAGFQAQHSAPAAPLQRGLPPSRPGSTRRPLSRQKHGPEVQTWTCVPGPRPRPAPAAWLGQAEPGRALPAAGQLRWAARTLGSLTLHLSGGETPVPGPLARKAHAMTRERWGLPWPVWALILRSESAQILVGVLCRDPRESTHLPHPNNNKKELFTTKPPPRWEKQPGVWDSGLQKPPAQCNPRKDSWGEGGARGLGSVGAPRARVQSGSDDPQGSRVEVVT